MNRRMASGQIIPQDFFNFSHFIPEFLGKKKKIGEALKN